MRTRRSQLAAMFLAAVLGTSLAAGEGPEPVAAKAKPGAKHRPKAQPRPKTKPHKPRRRAVKRRKLVNDEVRYGQGRRYTLRGPEPHVSIKVYGYNDNRTVQAWLLEKDGWRSCQLRLLRLAAAHRRRRDLQLDRQLEGRLGAVLPVGERGQAHGRPTTPRTAGPRR